MRPARHPRHGLVVSLTVAAVLLGLGVSPWLVGEAAADHDDRQPYKRTAVTWWYLWEPSPLESWWGPPFPEVNKLSRSRTVIAEDGAAVRFALTVVPLAFNQESFGTNRVDFLIATGYVDTQLIPWPNSLYSLEIYVTKIDPTPGCDKTEVEWRTTLGDGQGAETLYNGAVTDPPWPGWMESGAEFLQSVIPYLSAGHAAGELIADLGGADVNDPWVVHSPSQYCNDAWFKWQWTNELVDHATSFNQVAFDLPRTSDGNLNLGVSITAVFWWYEGANSYIVTDTLGPIYLYIKEDYLYPSDLAPVALSLIDDGDTTASSVALSWTQYNGADAPYYFRDYRVEYRLSGGTWQVAATLSSRTTTSYTVSGLQSDTTYDFRVWVADLFSRRVASNVRTATTDPSGGGGGGGGCGGTCYPLGDPGPGS